MDGWLLDTNVISEVCSARPDPQGERWIQSPPEQTLFLSILTIGEYQKGIHIILSPGDRRRPRLQRAAVALEAWFAGRVLSVPDQIVLRWGAMNGEDKPLTGHSPEVTAMLLAATASEHDLHVVTRNVAEVANSCASVFNPRKNNPEEFPVSG